MYKLDSRQKIPDQGEFQAYFPYIEKKIHNPQKFKSFTIFLEVVMYDLRMQICSVALYFMLRKRN